MDMSPQQALNEAAAAGDLEGVRKAIGQGADPKKNGSPALQFAAEQGHIECVRELIPLSNPLSDSSWALQRAASNGHTECVRLLIPVSAPKDNDSEPLLRAAICGHEDCVRLLIPVSDPKADDSNALRRAAENGQTECVRLLLPCSDTDAATKAAKAEGHTDAIDTMVSIMQSDELKSKHLKSARDRTRPML